MFVYESGNSLNLTFKGSIPVETPEVVIKGYKNGASLSINSSEVISVADPVEFEGKAKLFVYQKEGKLMITFNGIEGMSNPEVTLDETSDGVVEAVVNGESVSITYTDESVSVTSETVTEQPEPEVTEPEIPEPEVTEPEVVEPEVTPNIPEEDTEEE